MVIEEVGSYGRKSVVTEVDGDGKKLVAMEGSPL
jgi:hypothetical protein